MRILVFFDLPSVTSEEKREYLKFRKMLVKSGFLMMQESVYSKLALNTTVSGAIVDNIKKNRACSDTRYNRKAVFKNGICNRRMQI